MNNEKKETNKEDFLMFYGTFVSLNKRTSPQNDSWKLVIDIPPFNSNGLSQKEEIKKTIDFDNQPAIQVLIRLDPNISKAQNSEDMGCVGTPNEGIINQSKDEVAEDLPFEAEDEVKS